MNNEASKVGYPHYFKKTKEAKRWNSPFSFRRDYISPYGEGTETAAFWLGVLEDSQLALQK